ncbi:MAG: hydratase [Betaproteobacteria bacterium]|nr:hydratase [Betaproteobacteria bacterium]
MKTRQSPTQEAAAMIWAAWNASTRIDALPEFCRPSDRAAAYAIQREIVKLSGQRVVGWKIAATSTAGQHHIGVDGPLAGPLLAKKVLSSGVSVPLAGNSMNVAEAEFAFEMAIGLPPRKAPYVVQEVMAAVTTLAPAIEVPDTRFNDFAKAGASQLIADCACGCWLVVGAKTRANWRQWDLPRHAAIAYRNGEVAAEGEGANVLGDPRIALTWIANELATYGEGLKAGDLVSTGTCIVPVAIAPGDEFRVDFGVLGAVSVRLAA